ncbi:MAG: hypothetical protein ACOXZK_04455 [Bacteroidales bacterium]|nr:FMN-binding protein [Bacteroidales bacterium]
MDHEGVVAIVTHDNCKPYIVNTWNSYISLNDEKHWLVPMGGMETFEELIKEDNKVQISIGSKEVEGLRTKGTGFLIEADAEVIKEGEDFELMSSKFIWMRAVLVLKLTKIVQKI